MPPASVNPDDERSAEAKGTGTPRVLAVGFVFLWRTNSKAE
jgi:heme-degrading monooxygenase HmoA